MRNKFLYLSILLVFFIFEASSQSVLKNDSVTLGASYAKSVFYSLATGVAGEMNNADWDIAFATSGRSVSILTNEAKGIELYTYRKANASGWAKVDTLGMLWKPLYNADTTWEYGAFNMDYVQKNYLYDYGWGIYDPSTHGVTGDSLFIIKLAKDNFMKIIIEKKPPTGIYTFKYAKLDGTGEKQVNVNSASYPTKNFIYYSLIDNKILDLEPAKDAWDILFTKYMTEMMQGNVKVQYPVTGVLINSSVTVAEYRAKGLNQKTYETFKGLKFVTNTDEIGYDWKNFDNATYQYKMVDTVLYFLKGKSYYKLFFTNFAGSSTGKIKFSYKSLAAPTGIQQETSAVGFSIFPNPAFDFINVTFSAKANEKVYFGITDLAGKQIMQEAKNFQQGEINHKLNISGLSTGVYLIQIEAGNNKYIKKFAVKK
jgi:predicted lipoprotein with Yx(FWY)xxD motif